MELGQFGAVDRMSRANGGTASMTMVNRVSRAKSEEYCRNDTGGCSFAAYNPTALGTTPVSSYRQ